MKDKHKISKAFYYAKRKEMGGTVDRTEEIEVYKAVSYVKEVCGLDAVHSIIAKAIELRHGGFIEAFAALEPKLYQNYEDIKNV